jgi:hypothetical protein
MAHNGSNMGKLGGALETTFAGLDAIYDAVKQHHHQSFSNNVIYLTPEHELTAFNRARQMNRPHEFLQSLLDIIRVTYEPSPLGTTLLNSNLCYLIDAIATRPASLGYLSLVSEPDQTFSDFWETVITPYASSLGYTLNGKSTAFLICSASEELYAIDLVTDADDALHCLPSAAELVEEMCAGLLNDPTQHEPKAMYAGFCLDQALGNRLRVSMWVLLDEHT